MSKESVVPVCQDPDELLNLKQVAKILGYSQFWISEHSGSGLNKKEPRIPTIRFGRALRVTRAALRDFIKAHSTKQP